MVRNCPFSSNILGCIFRLFCVSELVNTSNVYNCKRMPLQSSDVKIVNCKETSVVNFILRSSKIINAGHHS
jgi:hypothetical protein